MGHTDDQNSLPGFLFVSGGTLGGQNCRLGRTNLAGILDLKRNIRIFESDVLF